MKACYISSGILLTGVTVDILSTLYGIRQGFTELNMAVSQYNIYWVPITYALITITIMCLSIMEVYYKTTIYNWIYWIMIISISLLGLVRLGLGVYNLLFIGGLI